MSRIARVVAPGVPHHVTQRGNRRQRAFFSEEDYRAYIELMARLCRHYKVEIWAYCLMPNHVHLIALPPLKDSLRNAIAEAHRRYTIRINQRHGWRGCLWQGRFFSAPMDDAHMLFAARYIELNPVRAGFCQLPQEYPWSSAAAHIQGRDDRLVNATRLLAAVSDWSGFLREEYSPEDAELFRKKTGTGRPLGSDAFVKGLEEKLGRTLSLKKPGPKAMQANLTCQPR